MSSRLAEADRGAEVSESWESTLAGLSSETSRLALSVGYARYLLSQPNPDAGVNLLARTLTTIGIPGPAAADARWLLRRHWRQDPHGVEQAWESVTASPPPRWLHLSDEHVETVVGWINTSSWTESHAYFRDHADQLLADQTNTVLDELSLSAPADLINQHRSLLEAIRKQGLDIAYRSLLLPNALGEWIATPTWEASRAFLHEHPELLAGDTRSLLTSLTSVPDPTVMVHQILLFLARDPVGIDGAYRSMENQPSLEAWLRDRATTDTDSQVRQAALQALATGWHDDPSTTVLLRDRATTDTEPS